MIRFGTKYIFTLICGVVVDTHNATTQVFSSVII
jgi:hypothetical protein